MKRPCDCDYWNSVVGYCDLGMSCLEEGCKFLEEMKNEKGMDE